MAVTGLLLVGFVSGHMAGNLLVFKGPEALNAYGAFLKSSAAVLWTVRLALLDGGRAPRLGRPDAHPAEPREPPGRATRSRCRRRPRWRPG